MAAIPFVACMALVASFYHLPPRVLPSIHGVEGGAPGVVHPNTDGSEDYGVMQVNSRWLVPLSRVAHLTPEDVRQRLIGQPCFNIAAAGLIMRTYLNETHGYLMLAVGNYHSHTPLLNRSYQALVMQSAWNLFGGRPPTVTFRRATPR